MKSYGQLWERITSQENLLAAWGRVRKGHAGSLAVHAFNIGFRAASTMPGQAGSHPAAPASRGGGNEQVNPRAAGSAGERRAGDFLAGAFSNESNESGQSSESIRSNQSNQSISSKRKQRSKS